MAKWIFQGIKDIQSKHLPKIVVADTEEEFNRLRELYYEALRSSVEPETYVKYEIWTSDIYIDVDYIIVQTEAIYKAAVSRSQIASWIEQHKESHHVLR
jgi:hypothetical protein